MVDTAAGVDGAAVGHDLIGAAGALTNEEIVERLDRLFHEKATVEGAILVLLGEVDRRQAYRDDGATSSEAWAVERFGVSTPTARAYAHLADKAWEIPHLMGALCAGDLTLDKVRAVADVATPETDRDLREQAQECSVRQLADLARTNAPPTEASGGSSHERRFLRFNDQCRTMTVQLPPESFAETRACLEARVGESPRTARRLGTSACATPSWRRSARRRPGAPRDGAPP